MNDEILADRDAVTSCFLGGAHYKYTLVKDIISSILTGEILFVFSITYLSH